MKHEPTSGWMLGIDTSTEWAGLALGNGSQLISRSWEAGRTQTTSVLPTIDAMFAEARMTPSELAAVAIATGPGTFTGLRVGMSIAKGFVLARDMPLVGIPTLEVAAAGIDADDVIVVLPAGRGRAVWQRFGRQREAEPHNTTIPELIDVLYEEAETLLVGELPDQHRDTIEAAHPNVRWQHRDPATLLWLARDRWRRGEVDDPVALEPTYLHGVTVSAGPVEDRLRRKR